MPPPPSPPAVAREAVAREAVAREAVVSSAANQKFAFNSSLLDQGLPKGGNYSRSTTVLAL